MVSSSRASDVPSGALARGKAESPVVRAASAAGAMLLGAELTTLAALPWAEPQGEFTAMSLALPGAVVACLFVLMLGAVGQRLPESWRRTAAELSLVGTVGLLAFFVGAAVSNRILVDEALKPRMLVAYAVSAGIALFVALLFWRALYRSELGRRVRRAPVARLLSIAMLALAVVCAVVDAMFLTHGYWQLHVMLLAITLAAFSAFFALLFESRHWSAWLGAGAVALAVAFSMPVLLTQNWKSAFDAMLRAPTSHQRLLLIARQLTDKDHDGFSASFGGGDCDDADEKAFPLSTKGRDCLGWLSPNAAVAAVSESVLESETSLVPTPDVILLVTVDAFRCGFGRTEARELVHACPNLQRLAQTGRLRLDGYTTYPQTSKALLTLNSLPSPRSWGEPRPLYLAEWLGHHGWYTHAVSIPEKQLVPESIAAFRSFDRSIEEREDASAVTAEAVTDRIIHKVSSHSRGSDGPLFVWAHYLDPHSPYMEGPRRYFALSRPIDRYALEIRRVDRAIGRLADTLARSPEVGRWLMLVTADHGEGLGEKGAYYHGAAINEPAVRVPMLAWSPDVSWLGRSPELPSSLSEVGTYLSAVALGRRFTSSGEAFFHAHVRGGFVFGVYRDGWKVVHHQVFGWTALYHLPSDPAEAHDLSRTRPQKLKEMTRRLAAHLLAAKQDGSAYFAQQLCDAD